MKRILVFLALVGVFFAQCIFASESVATIRLTQQKRDFEKKDRPTKDNRNPSCVFCVVDLQQHTIECSAQESILTYELWNENGEYLIVTNVSDYDLTEYLSGVSGSYTILAQTILKDSTHNQGLDLVGSRVMVKYCV